MPPFNERGYLPNGIYPMKWPDFCEYFGGNSHRQQQLTKLYLLLLMVSAADCTVAWIGGSFVTSKPYPDDFDGCFDAGTCWGEFNPILGDLDRQQAEYGGEVRPDFSGQFQRYLQTDKDGYPRGIVELDLRTLPTT
jgi:hypothetical protein